MRIQIPSKEVVPGEELQAHLETFRPKLVARVRQLGLSKELAEDVVQDVFVKLHEKRNEVEIPAYGLARQMVKHRCVELLRKRARQPTSSLEAAAQQSTKQSPIEIIVDVERALRQLPIKEQQVFARKLRGETLTEIAASENVTMDRAFSLLQKTRKSIKQALS